MFFEKIHDASSFLLKYNMKRVFFIFLFSYCLVHTLFAQNYIAEYGSDGGSKAQLLFNSTEWRYDVIDTLKVKLSSDEVSIQADSVLSTKVITQFNYRSLDKNVYLDEELLLGASKSLVIQGELKKPEWNIVSDSMKTIGQCSFNSHKPCSR